MKIIQGKCVVCVFVCDRVQRMAGRGRAGWSRNWHRYGCVVYPQPACSVRREEAWINESRLSMVIFHNEIHFYTVLWDCIHSFFPQISFSNIYGIELALDLDLFARIILSAEVFWTSDSFCTMSCLVCLVFLDFVLSDTHPFLNTAWRDDLWEILTEPPFS